MHQRHQVLWTPEAEDDATKIVDWFNDPINAAKVIDQLVEKADGLALLPERGRLVPELHSIGITTYREVLFKPWRMLYRVEPPQAARTPTVWIMAILDGRRDLRDLLFERIARPKR